MDVLTEAVDALLGGFSVSLTVFLLAAVGLLLVALGLYDGRFLLAASIFAYSLSLVSRSVIPSQPNLYVAVALGLMVLLGMTRARMPDFSLLRTGIFPATGCYLLLGVILLPASVDVGESLTTVATVLLACGYVWTMLSVCTIEEIRSSFRIVLILLMVASVAYVFINPAVGIGESAMELEGARWRGIMENPNGLGVIAALAFVLVPRSSVSIPSLVAVFAVLIGSGSRSATLALGIVAWPRLFGRSSRAVRRVAMIVAILVALPLLYSVLFSDGSVQEDSSASGVLRVKNTRAESWDFGTEAIRSNPFGGLGLGNDLFASGDRELVIASSVLRPMVELGLPALLPLGMVLAVGIRHLRSPESSMRTLFGFMLIHGIFEGWLFAGGSILFITFMVSASLMDLEVRQSRRARSSDDAFTEDPEPSRKGSIMSPLSSARWTAGPGFRGASTAG